MNQVFVDCDNTLVLYEDRLPHYYGILCGDSYMPNSELIDKLKRFLGTIIVWSSGGRDYARQVAELVLPKDLKYFAMSKFQFEAWCVLKEGDIVVDDQKELFVGMVGSGVRVLGPFDKW